MRNTLTFYSLINHTSWQSPAG